MKTLMNTLRTALKARILLAAIAALAALSCAPEIKLSDRDWEQINSDRDASLVSEDSSSEGMEPSIELGTWNSKTKEVRITFPNEADALREENAAIKSELSKFLTFYPYVKADNPIGSFSADELGTEYSYEFVSRQPSGSDKTIITVGLVSDLPGNGNGSLVAKISASDYTFAGGKKLGGSHDTQAGIPYYDIYETLRTNSSGGRFSPPYKQNWELRVSLSSTYDDNTRFFAAYLFAGGEPNSDTNAGKISDAIMPDLLRKLTFSLEEYGSNGWVKVSGVDFSYESTYNSGFGYVYFNFSPNDLTAYRIKVSGVENLETPNSDYYGVKQRIKVNGWFSKQTYVTPSAVWIDPNRQGRMLATADENPGLINNVSLKNVNVGNKSIELRVVFNPIYFDSTYYILDKDMDSGKFKDNFKVFIYDSNISNYEFEYKELDGIEFLNIESVEFGYSEVTLKLNADYTTYNNFQNRRFGFLIAPGFKYKPDNIIFGNYGNWNWVIDGVGNFDYYGTKSITQYVPAPSVTVRNITFNANGGNGAPPSAITIDEDDDPISLPSGDLTRYGYTLSGWSTNSNYPNGSGGKFYPLLRNYSYTDFTGYNITLYAVWSSNSNPIQTYTVTYDSNNAYSLTSTNYEIGNRNITLPSESDVGFYAANGYTFIGWSTSSSGTGTTYYAGDNFFLDRNITLYAKWQGGSNPIPYYTVTFNANGGTGSVSPQSAQSGHEIILPSGSELSRSGYTFGGWSSSSSGGGTTFGVGTSYTVNSETTLYAVWVYGAPPSTPGLNGSSTVQSSSSIQFSWYIVNAASYYKVYRSTTSNGLYSYIGDVNDTSYTDYGLNANTTYYYKVAAVDNSGRISQLSEYISATTSGSNGGAPATPQGLSASTYSSSSIYLSWYSVSGASYYKVYRYNGYSGYTQIGTTYSNTYYIDSYLDSGMTYYYKVSAVNDYGESILTDAKSATTSSSSSGTPDIPTGLYVTETTSSSVSLGWEWTSGANYYKVYYSNTASLGFGYLGNTSHTYYTVNGLDANTTYYFRVSAVNDYGESSLSDYTYTTTYNNSVNAPATPTGVSAMASGTNSINIYWDSVSGASSYKVYRSNNYYSGYDLIYTSYYSGYYADYDVSSGTTYYYKVSAVNSYGESALSGYYSATTYCEAPTLYTSVQSSSSIYLSWNEVYGASYYRLYRASSYSGNYYIVGEYIYDTYYYDNYLDANTTYYYKVSAFNESGDSSRSEIVSATTNSNSGRPDTPTGLTVTDTTSNSVSLSWYSVSGANYYRLYRASSYYGDYYSVADYIYDTYTYDNYLDANTTYYYKVSAGNDYGESEMSDYVSATTSGGGWPVWPPSSSTLLYNGTWVNDSLSSSNTEDWYYFSVYNGTDYYIHWKDSDNTDGMMDVNVAYYNSSGSQIDSYDRGVIYYHAYSNDTLYVKVYPHYYNPSYGSYAIAYNNSSDPPSSIVLNAPTNVTATTLSSNSIRLTWDSVSGANQYKVYRSTSSSGYYEHIETIIGIYWVFDDLEASTTYYFKVSAVSGSIESALSDYTYATTSSPNTLTEGVWTNGTITSASQEVFYTINVTAGTTYYIWWNDSDDGNRNKTGDIAVSAFYSNGDQIFSNVDHGYNSPRSFTPTASQAGTVNVNVHAYNHDYGYIGSYGIVYTENNATRPSIY